MTESQQKAKKIKQVLDSYILNFVIDMVFQGDHDFGDLEVDQQIRISSLITKGYYNLNTPKA